VDHAAASELLGVYAMDACEDGETAAIEAHLAKCAECDAEATRLREVVGWIAVSEAATPSEELRSNLLFEARNTGDHHELLKWLAD
jgi:anti-sigma factor RsiW